MLYTIVDKWQPNNNLAVAQDSNYNRTQEVLWYFIAGVAKNNDF